MNDGFKQRLVGAIILVSIVLILWPVIFSEGINPTVDKTSEISEPPAFEKYTVASPTRPKSILPKEKPVIEQPIKASEVKSSVSTEAAKDTVVKEASTQEIAIKEEVVKQGVIKEKTEAVIKQASKLDSQGLPEAWVLQVASFSQKKNAEEVKVALTKMGYKAYNRTVNTSEGLSTRVFVGPRFTESAFAKDKQIIDKAFSVKSMLVRFEQ